MGYCKIGLYFLVILFLNTHTVFASGGRPFVTEGEWAKYSKSYHYTEDYKTQKESTKTVHKNKQVVSPSFLPGVSVIGYLLMLILIAVILALIVLLVMGIVKQSNEGISNNSEFKVSTYENIENADLENDLQKFLTIGSYKEALRIQYLIVLRTLTKRRLVIWKMDKTNGSYLQEMYGKKGFEIFRKLTISFERAWYGDMQITETEYLRLIPIFDQINSNTGQ